MLTKEQKNQRKLERQKWAAERMAEHQEKLKVGAFLMSSYGCTMRRVSFWEVTEISKNTIALRPALTGGSGDVCSGTKVLLGSGSGKASHFAKMRSGVLSLVQEGRPRHYWDTLHYASVGQTEQEWSD